MLFSKRDYQYAESVKSVEIKLGEGILVLPNFKGEVTLIISHSRKLKNFWELILDNDDSDNFFEEVQKSDEIDIEDIFLKNYGKLDFFIRPKGEIKVESEDKTGFYAKGKTEKVYQVSSLTPFRLKEKNNKSLQFGLQSEGERQIYATQNIDDPKKDSFTWALKDSKKKKKIILPQKWNLHELDFDTEVKFKKLIKVHYEKAAKAPKVPKPAARKESNTKPIILYAGILSSLCVALSMYMEWSIPFFDDYNQAFGYSFIFVGIGIASLVYNKKKAAFIALGIIAIIYSLVGSWLQWPFPYIEDENLFNYKNLIFTGVILILIDLVPKLIGIPLLLLTIYLGYQTYLVVDSEGWEIIPTYFWISLIGSLFISIWLLRKKKIR